MSTHLDDFPTSAALAAGRSPTSLTASTNGPTVSFPTGDGPCFAIQQVGDAPGDGTLDGRIEQSADGTTWSAISGAVFAQVPGSDNLQVIRFIRSAKYVRWAATLAGDSPQFTVAVVIGQQKKTF